MLERIALHQTRLRTPGLGLDAKGVALGAKGLVLLPSLDRLVAWLSVYTHEHSLEELMPSLVLRLVRSKLGTREITLEFAAESSDRMDRMADTSRLVGGFTFTGTSRHFVQYRDAAAPFGYDATELLPSGASLALYHDTFTQTYDIEKPVDLQNLLLRLMPQLDPKAGTEPGLRYLVAEQGLGAAVVHYLVRSRVDGDVCVGEWPPESAFDEGPVRRTIVRVPEVPSRMLPLFRSTPGIAMFYPAGPGVAVEVGHRHPVELRACPVFDPGGLVLLRGRSDEAWVLPKLPQMGPLRAFARVELRGQGDAAPLMAERTSAPEAIRVPLRVLPSTAPWRNVTATWLSANELPLLRRIAYALPHETIARTSLAVTDRGVFLRTRGGIEALPLGAFYFELHPNLYVPAGYEVTPAIAPDVLHRALGAPVNEVVFITTDARALAIEQSAFVPLETTLLESKAWEPVVAQEISAALAERAIDLRLTPLGAFPMRDAEHATSAPEGSGGKR